MNKFRSISSIVVKEGKMHKLYCSKCNKCLTDDQGNSIMALSLSIRVDRLDTPYALVESNLGKYFKDKSWEWAFCYECLLDALMK